MKWLSFNAICHAVLFLFVAELIRGSDQYAGVCKASLHPSKHSRLDCKLRCTTERKWMSICPRCTAEQQLARVKEKDKPISLSLSHLLFHSLSFCRILCTELTDICSFCCNLLNPRVLLFGAPQMEGLDESAKKNPGIWAQVQNNSWKWPLQCLAVWVPSPPPPKNHTTIPHPSLSTHTHIKSGTRPPDTWCGSFLIIWCQQRAHNLFLLPYVCDPTEEICSIPPKVPNLLP